MDVGLPLDTSDDDGSAEEVPAFAAALNEAVQARHEGVTYGEFMRTHRTSQDEFRPAETVEKPSYTQSLYDGLIDAVCGGGARREDSDALRPSARDESGDGAARELEKQPSLRTRSKSVESGILAEGMKPVSSWDGAILE